MRLVLLYPKKSHFLHAEQIAGEGVSVILGLTPETAVLDVDSLRKLPGGVELANAVICSMVDDGGDLLSWSQEMVSKELFESTKALQELASRKLGAILVPEADLRTGDGATAKPILSVQELPSIYLDRQAELAAPPSWANREGLWWLDCRQPWSSETLEITIEMLRSEGPH